MNKIIQIKGVIDMNIITEVLDLLLSRVEKEQNDDFWRQVWLWLSINPDEFAGEVLKYCVWESIAISLMKRGIRHEDLEMYKRMFEILYAETYEDKITRLFEKYIQGVIIK